MGIGFVSSKTKIRCSPRVIRLTIGPLESADISRGTRSFTRKGVLNSGWSKHGNARRADSGWNWVKASQRPWSSTR